MSTIEISGELLAYINKNDGPDDIKERGLGALMLSCSEGMSRYGYTLVGKATVVATISAGQDLVEAKVKALREEQRQIIADAQAKSTVIEGQIQKLLAITFEG